MLRGPGSAQELGVQEHVVARYSTSESAPTVSGGYAVMAVFSLFFCLADPGTTNNLVAAQLY